MHPTAPPFRHRSASLAVAALFATMLASTRPAYAQTLAPGDPQTRFQITGWAAGVTNVMDVAPLPDGRLVIVQNGGDVAVRTKDGMVLKAVGHVEVEIDATKLNTTEGWRDIKICIFAKREAGEPATPCGRGPEAGH